MGIGLITIRPLERTDIPAAVALEEANQPQPWTTGIFEDELDREDRFYVMAEDDGLVGFAGVMVIDDEAHITNLLVAPERRREGIGHRLMTRVIRESVAMGARHLTLEVRSGNEAARRLYHRLGLAPVGVRPNYYQGEDALILWAHDIDSPDYSRRLS